MTKYVYTVRDRLTNDFGPSLAVASSDQEFLRTLAVSLADVPISFLRDMEVVCLGELRSDDKHEALFLRGYESAKFVSECAVLVSTAVPDGDDEE